ncbi:peptidase S10 [Sphingomonas sp. Root710]|uniref:S10 family peptidase n=1 Tax=Sphingomonas sp. Root710 TaxID=1736594 RepID=UPI0006FB1A4C|nr:peptidase S10 [Sphingomonas sp. Root710]KRB82818.1 peptidase S10 [Sphingomonas sp. Root710]
MRFSTIPAAIALAALSVPVSAFAADEKKPDDIAIPAPIMSVTKHKGNFGGQAIGYTATTGETYLTDKDGKPVAAIFATSYVKDGGDPKSRPVTFLFNGGPGSGSLWLHMGAFGPKRVAIPNALDDGAPPYPLVDNPDSLLDVTDIVFIDPVGTGFARALGKKEAKDYWGVSADAKSIAEFIRLWLNRNGRWNAPKYLGGESYGTTRSVAVLKELEGSYNDVALNGIILISTILDFGAPAEVQGNEMPYILNLPSMATTAWYHKKIPNPPASAAEIAAEARAFAIGPYAAALLKGNQLGAEERASVRTALARLTGLSEAFLDKANLRVLPGRFYKELLRDRGLSIGRLDTRYTGVDYDQAGEEPDNDPSFYAIDGAYSAAINSYLRDDLKLKMDDRSYVTIGGVGDWDWKLADQRGRDGEVYVNVAPYLGKALRENSGLRVFVGQGWYDFATPFFGAEYSLSRPGFDPARIRFHYYDAGHMMYVRPEDLHKLSADLRAFIRGN